MVMGAERAADVNSTGAAVRAEAIPARSSVNVRIRTAWMLTPWPAWFGAGLPAASCQSRAVDGAAPDGLAPAGGATTPTNAASVRAATNAVAHLLFRLDLLIPFPSAEVDRFRFRPSSRAASRAASCVNSTGESLVSRMPCREHRVMKGHERKWMSSTAHTRRREHGRAGRPAGNGAGRNSPRSLLPPRRTARILAHRSFEQQAIRGTNATFSGNMGRTATQSAIWGIARWGYAASGPGGHH